MNMKNLKVCYNQFRNNECEIINTRNLCNLLRLMLVVLLTCNLSCKDTVKKKKSEINSFFTIPFSEIITHQREVNLSEFANDVEIFQLENTPEALLGAIEDIGLTSDYIFVMCWAQPILQFSREGKFIKQIGAIGKGPGEYNICLKMSIDEKSEQIYIYTTEQSIEVFNFNGDYIKTVKFPALASFMKYWVRGRDSTFVSYFEPIIGNEPYVFIEYNEHGDTLQTIPNYIFYDIEKQADPPQISLFEDQNFAYDFEYKLHLKGCYNDTIYSYNKANRLVPKYFIDLGKHKLPSDLIYERKWNRPLPGNLIWTGVHETSDFIFIPYGYHFNKNKLKSEKKERGLVLYSKKTQEGVAIIETRTGGFKDDIAGGPDFCPTLAYDNVALMVVSAMEMKQYLLTDQFKNKNVKFPEKKENLNQLKRIINENDNDYLILVKF
ncbi:6-bladed beta-propeller [uncultured Draconibacterium sp.]|uniref:6-bladed beta-propeller n=1 Tax=uncultured Draconibacterium sp. TaxID=1573823 RepID=UPI003749546E